MDPCNHMLTWLSQISLSILASKIEGSFCPLDRIVPSFRLLCIAKAGFDCPIRVDTMIPSCCLSAFLHKKLGRTSMSDGKRWLLICGWGFEKLIEMFPNLRMV